MDDNFEPLSPSEKIVLIGPFLHEKCSHLVSWALDSDISIVKSIAE